MLRKIFGLCLFLPLACVNTTRDNRADPGSGQHDSGPGVVIDTGTSTDSGTVGPTDAGSVDSGGIVPGVDGCTAENLRPCYLSYRAFGAECERGTCVVGGRQLNTILGSTGGRAAKELCAVACNPEHQPGLCNFNFNGSGWAVAACSLVSDPPTDCPAVLDPTGDFDAANHGVCRIPCGPGNDAENSCLLQQMDDVENQQDFTFTEGCNEENRCTNTGQPGVGDCGNGVVNDGEECDDGNRDPGDGCSQDCLNEPSTVRSKLGLGHAHSCLINNDGTVSCWGSNSDGQLGPGQANPSLTPVMVVNLAGFQQVSAGSDHNCAYNSLGVIYCWGNNTDRQLGFESTLSRANPVALLHPPATTKLTSFMGHNCALSSAQNLYCWGNNSDGQLGIGSLLNTGPPAHVSILGNILSIAAGYEHSCAIVADRTVLCWGKNNFGQLGNDNMELSTEPVVVANINDAVQIVAGGFHTCVLETGGSVRCWGKNQFGQLGNDSTIDSYSPVTVLQLSGVIMMSGGLYFTCAQKDDGQAYCWGSNTYGQLGDGTTTEKHIPNQVTFNDELNVEDIDSGYYHNCATMSDGTVTCWGRNQFGQLGDNSITNRSSPVTVSF